ncbi:MAG: hypothetical protein HOH43_01190 [Candidatus Latescibacteria bacterium]|jgi:hypothetical protein|nr:hypothetical protein [Candidatus Latescibacterota bacterium]
MRLYIIGCEYSGTTTLAVGIHRWAQKAMGADLGLIHDHWKIPDVVAHYPDRLSKQEHKQVLGLSTRLLESYMRHNLYYHTPHESAVNDDNITIGHYIEDTIYARLYYQYGGPQQPGDREIHSKKIESIIMNLAPETVLLHIRADEEVIARRMKDALHPYPVVPEEDIDRVSRLFSAAFHASRIGNKMEIDTSHDSPETSVDQFVSKVQPFLTRLDRERLAVQ